MTDFAEMNARVVEEFRNNAGVVGGFFEGMPLVLLTTTGARSGAPRLSPVAYLEDGGVVHVFASKAGAPDNPGWYYNLKANPELSVEQGTETYRAIASEVTGAERDRIYAAMATKFKNFAEYETMTDRTIPVLALTRM